MELLDGTQIERTLSRGKFSQDRHRLDAIHHDRFNQWQMGSTLEEIAASEGVTVNAIRNSIYRCELKLPGSQALAIRERRHKLITISRLGQKCVNVLERLLDDENPFVQLKALDQMRKAVASEVGTGIQVNTMVNVANASGSETFDFETQLASIRRQQQAAHGKDRKSVVEITPETGEEEDHDGEPDHHGA